MAYIVLKDTTMDEDTVKQSISDMCQNELKDYEVPKYYRYVDSLPYTQNSNYDFRLLEKMGNDFISQEGSK